MTKTLEDVRKFFANDKFATENGAVIDKIDTNYSKCSLKITDTHLNAMGTVMGGVAYTLADFAFAVAANWNVPSTVSLNATINYLGIAKGTELIAEASIVKDGRTTCYYTVTVKDNLDNLVAVVNITGFKKN